MPPGGDRKCAAGFDHAPQFPNQRLHIRDKENTKDADDRLKVLVRKAQISHISQAKLDSLEVALRRFRPRLFEQLLCEINPQDGSVWANQLGGLAVPSAA